MTLVHASCVLVGAAGVLIRGPSGSGKTALALALIERSALGGRFARLVADDQVLLSVQGGRLVARVPDAIAGLVERRGRGLVLVPFEPASVVRLVVDCIGPEALHRMPEEDSLCCEIEGVVLPRQPVGRGPEAIALVLAALAGRKAGAA